MIAEIEHKGRRMRVSLDAPIDLSLPLDAEAPGPRAWYVGPPRFTAVKDGGRTYLVAEGASVNFRDVAFNPHGHGTHTESVGHIAREIVPVGPMLDRYFFTAQVISVRPMEQRQADGGMDRVITLDHFREAIGQRVPEAVVIRSLPNAPEKRTQEWSRTNPAYVAAQGCTWLRSIGVRHLLLDTPSVDREADGGVLAAHHAFWDHPNSVDHERTITELIFVPDHVADGEYLLELQFPHFINDAAPSRPVLYALLP